MRQRLILAVLGAAALMALSACSAVNCGAAGDGDRAGGGCRAHTTF
ncbi:MAG TPA: hypothetical protein VG939_17455 [Caulobacteraceae bacterium]|nr:hypothetical protein [Caulobacteraceae bacterium]